MMMLVGGGLVSFWGPVFGGAVSSSRATSSAPSPTRWLLWYGLLFMVLVMFRPEGVAGLSVAGGGVLREPAPRLRLKER